MIYNTICIFRWPCPRDVASISHDRGGAEEHSESARLPDAYRVALFTKGKLLVHASDAKKTAQTKGRQYNAYNNETQYNKPCPRVETRVELLWRLKSQRSLFVQSQSPSLAAMMAMIESTIQAKAESACLTIARPHPILLFAFVLFLPFLVSAFTDTPIVHRRSVSGAGARFLFLSLSLYIHTSPIMHRTPHGGGCSDHPFVDPLAGHPRPRHRILCPPPGKSAARIHPPKGIHPLSTCCLTPEQ